MTTNQTQHPRILCIDDDTHTCRWIRIVLKANKINCVLETANAGRDAFARLMSEPFDLAIMEYALSDMTGVQLCGLLRTAGIDVPVMFLTVMDREVDRQMAIAAGANEYLCKPEDLDIFPSVVSQLLSKGRFVPLRPVGSPDYAKAA